MRYPTTPHRVFPVNFYAIETRVEEGVTLLTFTRENADYSRKREVANYRETIPTRNVRLNVGRTKWGANESISKVFWSKY